MPRARIFKAGVCAAFFTCVAPAFAADDIALGEYLSATCVTCHQKSGKVTGGVPSITGWPAEQFIAVMEAYRKKERENEVMRALASGLSTDDIAALAVYFRTLGPGKK